MDNDSTCSLERESDERAGMERRKFENTPHTHTYTHILWVLLCFKKQSILLLLSTDVSSSHKFTMEAKWNSDFVGYELSKASQIHT